MSTRPRALRRWLKEWILAAKRSSATPTHQNISRNPTSLARWCATTSPCQMAGLRTRPNYSRTTRRARSTPHSQSSARRSGGRKAKSNATRNWPPIQSRAKPTIGRSGATILLRGTANGAPSRPHRNARCSKRAGVSWRFSITRKTPLRQRRKADGNEWTAPPSPSPPKPKPT